MRADLLCLAAALVLAAPVGAATLKPMGTLDGPSVRLSDLFDAAGPNAARVLGPAPAPGGRIIVEAAQLAAIARQFGVEWRPLSLADRTVLDRPGRPFPREDAMEAVRASLVAAGAPAEFDLEVPGFAAPLVPPDGTARATVSQVEYDPPSGRFAALLSIIGPAMEPINMRVAGRALETIELPVAATRLAAGSVLRPQDVRMARLRTSLIHAEIAHDRGEAVGLALRRAVAAGQPLPLADLAPPALVQKGATVLMLLDSSGIALTGQGQALEAGALGEHVRVLNPISRAVLQAEVTGADRVRIRPDSSPLIPAGRLNLAAGR